jgi:stearoyl-CoA desaturase (delta-9 desaturase)
MSADSTMLTERRSGSDRINWIQSVPFFLVHLVPLAAIWTGVQRRDVWLCIGLFYARMFFISGGLHRYFAHRTYKTSRVFQFIMALGGTFAAQKGPLWWAGWHRWHHRFSDKPSDVHSPQRGFWWAHVGWILTNRYKDTKVELVKQWVRYPELRWLNRWYWIPPTILAVAVWALGGWSALVIGFFLSTVLLYHATFFINSLAHLIGWRRFETDDTSGNSLLLALLTMGEGWHNDHHHRAWATKQGAKWWQIDLTYYVLWFLSLFGIVWDLTRHPRQTKTIEEGRAA